MTNGFFGYFRLVMNKTNEKKQFGFWNFWSRLKNSSSALCNATSDFTKAAGAVKVTSTIDERSLTFSPPSTSILEPYLKITK